MTFSRKAACIAINPALVCTRTPGGYVVANGSHAITKACTDAKAAWLWAYAAAMRGEVG